MTTGQSNPLRRLLRTGRWILGAGLAALLAGGAVCAQEAAKAGDSYLWTFQFKKNDTIHLKTQIKIVSKDTTSNKEYHESIDHVVRRKVQAVSAMGDGTLLETYEKSTAIFEGMPVSNELAPPILETYTKKGFVLKSTVGDATGQPLEPLFIMVHETPTPEMAVKVGEVWKTDTQNRMVKGQKVTITSTLIGPEKSLGVDTLKVKVQMQIPPTAGALDKDFINVEGTYNVEPQTGRLIHTEYKMTNVPNKSDTLSSMLNVEITTDYLIPGLTEKGKADKSDEKPTENP